MATTDDAEANDDCIERFEQAWQSGFPELQEFLPPASESSHFSTLCELVIIDMEFRWKRATRSSPDDPTIASNPKSVEDYIEQFPTLDTPDTIGQLAGEEFTIRWKYGDRPSPTGFKKRFPNAAEQFDSLTTILASSDQRPIPKPIGAPGAFPVVPNFAFEEEIGSGGMGSVFLAQQESPVRRKVAVKVIRRGMDSKEVVARFQAERQALAMMDHPNIARIYEAGSTKQGQPFFAMEYVPGAAITDFCKDQQLSIRERLELFCDVCGAIQHAHQKAILHRDLKPSNILVSIRDDNDEPVAKVIDFGLAKALDPSEGIEGKMVDTQVGQVLGTLKYMSPEQAEVKERDIDTRADVYALGVILYELLTDQTPLDEISVHDKGLFEVLEHIRDFEPSRPSIRLARNDRSGDIASNLGTNASTLQQVLRGDLDWVVMKALEKDRERRYDSASSLADDIRRFLNHEPVVARPPSATYRLQKFTRKNRLLVGSGATILLLLVVGITTTAIQAIRARRAEAEANRHEATALAKAEEADRRRIESDELRDKESEARKAAETNSERAERILHFVIDSFKAANPMTGAKKDMLARDVLVQALENVQEQVSGDPLRQAELYFELGSSLHGIGDYASAIRAGQLAKSYFSDMNGPNHERTIRANNLIADALLAQRNGFSAWDVYNDGLLSAVQQLRSQPKSKRSNWTSSPLVVESMIGMARATVLPSSQMQHDAERSAQRAFTASKQLYGQENLTTEVAMSTLAEALILSRKSDEAVDLSSQIVQQRAARLGEDHPETVNMTVQLSRILTHSGQHEKAVETIQQSVRSLQQSLGRRHPLTCEAECQWADALGASEEWSSGRKILADLQGRMHNSQPAYRRVAARYARFHLEQNELDEAISLYPQSPRDVAWLHIISNQPGKAAQVLGEWAANEKGMENKLLILKRQFAMLVWSKDYQSAAEIFAEREKLLESISEKPDVALDLDRIRLLVGLEKWAEASLACEKLLGQPSNPDVPDTRSFTVATSRDPSSGISQRQLQKVEVAWCNNLYARCLAELDNNDVLAMQKSTESFKQLQSRMPQMPDYLRWTCLRAAERTSEIQNRSRGIDSDKDWQAVLAKLEEQRVQLTLEDTWHDTLYDQRSTGPTF